MLRKNPLHDGNGTLVIVVLQIQQQTIGRCHDSVFDVGMEGPFVLEFDVVNSFRWIPRNLFRSPVNVFTCLTVRGLHKSTYVFEDQNSGNSGVAAL